MTNEVVTIHSEGITVERLNSLLDKITEKPFVSASLAAQSIRAALDLHGLTLPHLEVEGDAGSHVPPPVEGEWLFRIKDADGPDGDFDDYLSLYIVMDHIVMKDIGNACDCYAQVISSEEIETIAAMKDDDYQNEVGAGNETEHDGDRSGESEYQKQVRHVGGLRQEK